MVLICRSVMERIFLIIEDLVKLNTKLVVYPEWRYVVVVRDMRTYFISTVNNITHPIILPNTFFNKILR